MTNDNNTKKNKTLLNKDAISAYNKALRNFPPITKTEERRLLERYKKYNDISARQKLITSNLRYAMKYAIEHNSKKLPLEDLIEEANVGLIEAIDRFELSNDNRIGVYANWRMLYNIQNINAGVIPTNTCEDTDYTSKNDYQEWESDICEDSALNCLGIDYDKDDNGESFDAVHNKEFVLSLLDTLEEKEGDMIRMYYGVSGMKEHTLQEIGDKYGICKERVRQIIDKGIRKMRVTALVEVS